VAVDSAGTVYVADTGNAVIRKVTASGVVTTLAGLAGSPGSADGTGSVARFAGPRGVAVDSAGTVYVADGGNHTIRKVTASGVVTTLAGLAGSPGGADGTGSAARFNRPGAVTLARAGTIYVADAGNHTIRKVTTEGVVTTAGLAGRRGSEDGTGSLARFNCPGGVAASVAGNLYVADTCNHAIRLGVPDSVDADGLPDDWEARMGLSPYSGTGHDGPNGDPDGDGVTNLLEYGRGTHPRGFVTRYFAEGTTLDPFETRLALLNPGVSPAVALLRFEDRLGRTTTRPLRLNPRSRATVFVNALAGLDSSEFTTTVETDELLVVDRTMAWGGNQRERRPCRNRRCRAGRDLVPGRGLDRRRLQSVLPAPERERDRGGGAACSYLRPIGTPLEKAYTLPPHSRTTIWVNQEDFANLGKALASSDVSAVVEATNGQPLILERAMYLDLPGQVFGAGHESAGVTAPATEWFLAEGATGPFFDLFVLVANPGDATAQIEATYLLPDGATVVKSYTVGAYSRFNIWVDYEDPRLDDTAVSTTIRSRNDVPVVVERAMWWPGSFGQWYEAHNSPGTTTTGTKWALAEGEVNATRNLETYILVANTSPGPADVKVALLFEDGTSAEQTFRVQATSRFNVPVGLYFPQAAGQRFGAIVESLGTTPAPIVVERAMYWATRTPWAAGTNALATKLQ
jgi:hypothetical protein